MEEGGIILSGQLEVTVDSERRILGPGDAYYFESRRPHRFRYVGAKPSELISACTPPTFLRRARGVSLVCGASSLGKFDIYFGGGFRGECRQYQHDTNEPNDCNYRESDIQASGLHLEPSYDRWADAAADCAHHANRSYAAGGAVPYRVPFAR